MGRTLCVVTPVAGLFGHAASEKDCSPCYELSTGFIVGIVIGDIILTVLIALTVYSFVYRLRSKTRLEALEAMTQSKRKMNPSLKNKKPEPTESPYQELQGMQNDIYSDLREL